jgi:hypothetical protein
MPPCGAASLRGHHEGPVCRPKRVLEWASTEHRSAPTSPLHPFQHAHVDGIHYFITGAGSKVTREAPTRFVEAHTVAWAAVGHFLLIEIKGVQMTLRPIAAGVPGSPLSEVVLRDAAHQPVTTPVIIAGIR